MPKRSRWPAERLANAAFLAGRGWPAERIAAHRDIQSTPASVLQHLGRFGYDPGSESPETALIAIPVETAAGLAQQAHERGVMPHDLATRLLDLLAADPVLLDNVIDGEEIIAKRAMAFHDALADLAHEAAR